MKKKIFIRLFAVTLLSVLLMFLSGIAAVNLNANNVVNELLREETELAATLITKESDFELFEKYKNSNDFRITVFDLEGNELYESDTTATLKNHVDREEIRNALAEKPEAVRRYSETFGCYMTYYALKTRLSDGREIILRLAVKSSQVSSYISAIVPLLFVVLVIAVVISFVMSDLLSKSVSAKVTEIGESLKSLNGGEYVPIKTDMSEPELFAVLNQINELNANIHNHIRIAEGERGKLDTVLGNVSQSIIALDKDKKIVFANKSALETFNGTLQDVGRDLMFLIDDLSFYEKITERLGENYTFSCEYDGRQLSVALSKVTDNAISDEISTILIITDVTGEKLVEKQKSDFFANASHELKTPVTVLQGLSELLLTKDEIGENAKKTVERIHKESLRLGSLTSDMLTLSKIENGGADGKTLTEVSLGAVAEEAINELSEEISKKNLSTEIKGDATLTADRAMTYELIENLVSNAVKYNKDGGSVAVIIAQTDTGVRLQVKDTGIGIEKEHLPRLCERFYRVDKSHSKRIGGTGLGLAIVKHICAVCGARLSIESDFGLGTCVTVDFTK